DLPRKWISPSEPALPTGLGFGQDDTAFGKARFGLAEKLAVRRIDFLKKEDALSKRSGPKLPLNGVD
ncbi:MAG TPA: hypothetical protein VFG95_05005, partial [Nitrospiria bacterium]|nr:hypothetical protein [Nitrospiria bacterium]